MGKKSPGYFNTCEYGVLTIFSFLCFSSQVIAQQLYSGKITDANGASILGATIALKGTAKGTYSDSAGHFTISAKKGDVLQVSYVGFSDYQVELKNQTQLKIILSNDINGLEDVVVIGYGTSKKKDLTGAVASVAAKDFNKGVYASPDLLIQGKVPGVQIISNNGQPGSATTVKIRGSSALTGTGQPLYVIDGIPLDGRSLQAGNNPLNFLNPIDISSIDVLKDASATAIYGSRAAYGVIIINTKKGKAGATKLDVAASAGYSSPLKKIKVLDASQYREAIKYYGVSDSYDYGGNENALDAIFQNGFQQNYSMAGSGGNENGKYRFSAGILDQDGLLINTSFKKYNADVSANFKLLDSKKLGLDLYLNSSQYIKDGSLLSGGNYGIVNAALGWDPTEPLRNPDGSLNLRPGGNGNPVALSELVRDNLKVTTVLGSISPYYKITSWLEYKLLFSINYSTGISRSSVHQAIDNFGPDFPVGVASIGNNELITKQLTNTLNFNKEIFHEFNLNAVAGYEYMKFTNKGFGLTGHGVFGIGFGNYGLDYTNYVQYSSTGSGSRSITSYIDPLSELQSFFGRTIFSYKDKYLLTATLRTDGSTKFGENNKYGYFPSFAAAWNISKEKFFHIDFINSLKIRGGWGKTGNQEFPAGSSQALYAFRDNATIVQVNNPNPDLKWQSDRQYNLGIDFSLFNSRMSGTIDYFNKATTSLLFPSPPIQPAPPGSTVRWLNLDGEILNKGIEFLLNTAIVKQEKIGFDLSVNATFIKNNVSNFPTPVYTGYIGGFPIQIIQNGYPMNTFYTRKFIGMDKSTGFSLYEDDGNTFYYVGNPNPKTVLGFTANFRYKNFSVVANMNGAFGQDIYYTPLNWVINVGHINGGQNIAQSVYEDPVKESFANPVTYSSRYIRDGSYMKMANLTLSYNLGNLAKTFKGSNIYITGQNLFIITNYPGFDPELNPDFSNNSVPSLGIDGANYPTSRSIIIGINFSL